MKLCIWAILASVSFCQTALHQPDLRKLFADHLFCDRDYLRASEEYRSVMGSLNSDTVSFKLALSLAAIDKYEEAASVLDGIGINSSLRIFVKPEQIRFLYLQNSYLEVRSEFPFYDGETPVERKLRNFSYLFTGTDSLPSLPYMLLPFDGDEKKSVSSFYEAKISLPSKDPVLAGFLSALVPGLGKIYTEEYGDAAFAFLATGIFAYLAYTNFRADHQFRAYLFTGIAAWFYAGNIYGAAASATIYNARVDFSFTSLLGKYIKDKNYFLPDYGFCQ